MGIMTERRLAALTRVYALCTADPLPAGLETVPAGFATQVAALKESIMNVTSFTTAQGAGLRVTVHSTRERRDLRRSLRERQLQPLSQAARTLNSVRPGLADHFRVPPSNAREAQLLTAASGMAEEASKPEFMPLLSAQLGADFLDRINDAIQAITTSGNTNETGRRGRVGATTGVSTALATGRYSVQYLLTMVRACCFVLAKTNPVAAAQTLRRFETAARIERPAKGIKLVAQTSVQPAQPAPTNSTETSSHASPGTLQAAA